MARTLYIIDAYAQIFRAYYAIRGGMQSPVTGEPTHAVFGFTGMLLKLFSELKPDYVAVASDAPGKTFRDELYAEYKATREETPADLKAQIPRVMELIEAFGIPVVRKEGLEADDVIASIAHQVLSDPNYADVRIRIVSKDKDLEQLLCDRVTMFDIHKDTELDVKGLWETKGIRPDQVIDLLALTGDSADNVPGVEGIGPKTAAKLIQEFGSLENILKNVDKIPGKRRENLEAAAAHLPLSIQLVTLKKVDDLGFDLESARVRSINLPRVINLFRQLGFRRYQEDVRKLAAMLDPQGAATLFDGDGKADAADPGADGGVSVAPGGGVESAEAGRAAAGSGEGAGSALVAVEAAPGESALEALRRGAYRAVKSREELDELVATLEKQEMISVDTETTGLELDAELCGLCFAWTPGEGVYVPVRSLEPDSHLDEKTVLDALRPVLEDPKIEKCGHNLKFDARMLLKAGVRLRGITFDSMLASVLIDPGKANHKLDQLALAELGHAMMPITALIGESQELTMDCISVDRVTAYAAEDADIALRLYHRLLPKVREMGMEDLVRKVEAPLAAVLAEMEANGIMCDPEELLRQGEELKVRVEELRRKVWEIAGVEFNLDSPAQLAEVLFEKLGLPHGKKTKTGYSTDVEVLTNLAAMEDRSDPRTLVPGLILEYRQLAKLISTYLGNLAESVDPRTGRIHTTFHQLVTATGRLASHRPNLQNIPVRTDVGRQIRKAFRAPEGHMLICADYSQIELRILAHLSGDPGLIEAFEKDLDIHAAVASKVFGTPIDQVTREQRANAKTINFGIIYGITAFGLSRRIEGLGVDEAAALINDYKARFPGIETFMRACVQHAMEHGYVATIMGRRRLIPEIHSSNRNRRSLGERLAINSVVQGSAADLIKLAMVNVQRRIDQERLPLKLLLQIHDELVLEAPEERAEELAAIVREEMEQAMQLRVPLKAEAGIGPDWMSAK